MNLSIVSSEAGHVVEFGYYVWYFGLGFLVVVLAGALAANNDWLYKDEIIVTHKSKKH
ncbi:MAG TPA: hypothetical protein VN226_09320 [Anaerolineales bacterium]|nr:hypothetical protein [Anaerolineales bacterium]